MSEGPEWFAPRRYGIGTGLPIAWQGWAVLAAYAAIIGLALLLFRNKILIALSIVGPATVGLLVIIVRTTRGGWRWRWGEKE